MPRRPPRFAYLSVEAFRKLTPHQKQEYLEEIKNHRDDPIRHLTGDQLHPEDPSRPLGTLSAAQLLTDVMTAQETKPDPLKAK